MEVNMFEMTVQIVNISKTSYCMLLINIVSVVYGNGDYHAVVLKHQSAWSEDTENDQHPSGIQNISLYSFPNYYRMVYLLSHRL